MAGRIPQQFIDDLLDRTDIVDVIDARVTLRKTGKNYSALCPFHQEKSPSFSVSPDKQMYYCFGCGAGGNAIGFIMDFDRLDFRATIEELARRAGMELPEESVQAPQQSARQLNLYTQLERSRQYYQQQLRESDHKERAIEYLKTRGLTGQIARDFAMGYAPPGWENLHHALVESEEDEQLLISAGMLVKKEPRDDQPAGNSDNDTGRRLSYDRFRDRIMFPIRDSRGRTIAFGGRVLGDDKPKYLNSPESPVFHKGRELYGLYEAKQANNRITRFLIVEGYMDVVALAQHGIPYAVATLGTATSEAHLNKLFRIAPELVFCFDGDNAGRQAAQRALETVLPVMEDGRQAKFLFLPEGEDPDTLVRAEGTKAFESRVDQAQVFSEFFFQHLKQQVDIESIDGKAHLSKLALPLIKRLPQGAMAQLMLNRLSQITGLDNLHLEQMLRKTNVNSPRQEPPRPLPADEPQRRTQRRPSARSLDSIAQRALRLLLQQPGLADYATGLEVFSESEDPDIQLLIQVLNELKARPGTNAAILVHHWHGKPEQDELIRLASKEALDIDYQMEFEEIMSRLLLEQKRMRLENLKNLVVQGRADQAQQKEYIQLLGELKQVSTAQSK